MIAVIQRVRSASVRVGEETVGAIGPGMLVLAAVVKGDTVATMKAAAEKLALLRIFSDDNGKMNRDIKEAGGAILVVSQFTLAASLARGRRPSFDRAEEPARANELFERFVFHLRESGVEVQTGRFREMMIVALENDGPVTFVYEG